MGIPRNFMPALGIMMLSGCASIVSPNLAPDPDIAKAYDQAPTLPNAISVGTSMRDRYVAKLDSQIAWERGVGVGLVAGTAIAADLALRSVGKSEILGLGLAGAAAYTSVNWLFSKPQQMIYVAGAGAVQCAIDVMQPLLIPSKNRDELDSKINQIVGKVDAVIRQIPVGAPTTKSESMARASMERANALLPAAREALATLDSAGIELRSSLSAIQIQVTNAYIASSPSLQGLVDSLGKALPQAGSNIIGVQLEPIPQPDPKLKSTASPSEKQLESEVEKLDALVVRVAQIVASVNVKPREQKLRLCNVDPKQAGVSMKVAPSGNLSVPAGRSATVIVSGGVLPYRAEWLGLRPASDQVTLRIESGQGFVTVDTTPGAATGTYKLLLLDAGQGREVINVVVGGSSAAQRAGSATSSNTQNPAPADPMVAKVQKSLIARGIKTVKVDGNDSTLTADGRLGKTTVAAMRRYLKEEHGMTDDQIPDDQEALLKDVAQLLGIE